MYLYYILCLRYTILIGNPRIALVKLSPDVGHYAHTESSDVERISMESIDY